MKLRPFFSFYGAKAKIVRRYPAPTHQTIVEPFAGSASYACAYPTRQVILVEKDPTIANLWRWLIEDATPTDVMALPDLEPDQTTNDLDINDAARSLIGFWLNKGSSRPCRTPSKWMRSDTRSGFWSEAIRLRIASQLQHIRHWQVIHGDYSDAPNIAATWFIDPPYQIAGTRYRHSSKQIDFTHLADWVLKRQGQVMVCENVGADWLPFQPFTTVNGQKRSSTEAIWTNEPINLFDARRGPNP